MSDDTKIMVITVVIAAIMLATPWVKHGILTAIAITSLLFSGAYYSTVTQIQDTGGVSLVLSPHYYLLYWWVMLAGYTVYVCGVSWWKNRIPRKKPQAGAPVSP
jgi:hypothetical protein